MKKAVLLTALVAAVLASPARAQPVRDRTWTFHIAAGYAVGYGVVDDYFDGGLSIEGGATWMPRRGHFGVWMQGAYAGLDVNDDTLKLIGVRDGDMRIWSVGTGGIWASRTKSVVNVYLAAGGGYYHREIDLVNPDVETVPGWCSDWWGYCQPGSVVLVEDYVGKDRTNEFGYIAKVGLTFTLKNQSQIYVDLSYNNIGTPVETEFIPLTVGYRW